MANFNHGDAPCFNLVLMDRCTKTEVYHQRISLVKVPPRICSRLLKESLSENFIFCAAITSIYRASTFHHNITFETNNKSLHSIIG